MWQYAQGAGEVYLEMWQYAQGEGEGVYLEVWHYAQGEGKGGQVIARDIQTFQQLEFGYFVR